MVVTQGLVAPHMWGPPGSETELMSPTLAGRFFTAEPPGKPQTSAFYLT